ncbi:unnamed protein product [Anisakis simplex]|uniref:Uncharacterized protein n=1 Tax=Anisakis simplex TaxID=6269 RepID=A0A0M3JTP2_ANISI|nr:unnamed protein product [Anisakis simplex]
MDSEPLRNTEILLSHIYNAIAEHRSSQLIALLYDRILRLSGRSSLTRYQVEAFFNMLELPSANIPESLNCNELCELVEKSFDDNYGDITSGGHIFQYKDNRLKVAKKCVGNDEANFDELKILSTLNTLRKNMKCCTNSLRFIREENLIRTVLRQERAIKKLKNKLAEAERTADLLAAEYFAERCKVSLLNENSECDSGCNTERSASPNSSTSKGVIMNRKRMTNRTTDECACNGAERIFVGKGEKNNDLGSYRQIATSPHSVSIMWMCNPSTSFIPSNRILECDSLKNPGESTKENGDLFSSKHIIDYVCCSVALQRRSIPNNTQPHPTVTQQTNPSANNHQTRTSPQPICRSECVAVDVTACRKSSTQTVRWIQKQNSSITVCVKRSMNRRKRIQLQRLELNSNYNLFDPSIHFDYKRLKMKRIIEYKIPLLCKIN